MIAVVTRAVLAAYVPRNSQDRCCSTEHRRTPPSAVVCGKARRLGSRRGGEAPGVDHRSAPGSSVRGCCVSCQWLDPSDSDLFQDVRRRWNQGYAWLCLARRSLRRLPCPRPGGPVSLPLSGLSGALGGRALFLGGAGAAAAGAVLRRGAGVRLVIGEWHGAPVRLRVTRHWTGPGDGHGRLLACRAEVIADGRGAAGRPRRQWLWLPAPDGTVTAAGPGETMQGLPGGPAGSPGRGGRGRGGAACVAGSGGPVPMRLARWWRRGWRAAGPSTGHPLTRAPPWLPGSGARAGWRPRPRPPRRRPV